MKTIIENIDTRYGTENSPHFSNGNALPYTGYPFGMNYFVPQTSHTDGAWFFHPTTPTFQGIRLTHQPSPWIGDFSWLLVTPVIGEISQADILHRQSSYRPEEATFQPHYLKIDSLRYSLTTELTPTLYGAVMRCQSPSQEPLRLLLHSKAEIRFTQKDKRTILLELKEETQTTKQALVLHVALAFDQEIQSVQSLEEDFSLTLDKSNGEVKIATSFISSDQAFRNLPSHDFEQSKEKTKEAWENYLHRLEIVDQGKEDRRMFDHALYRLFLFPQTFYERDADGREIHFDLKHQAVRPGKAFTNTGFWDSFRTNFPLLGLLAPEKYRDMLEGFYTVYQETGYLPKWLAPDERGMMPGTLIDGVIADGAIKGLIPDLEEDFLTAMLQTATKADPKGIYGRHGAAEYQHLGYLPSSHHESVSHTLDYCYSDFCIATLADRLGKPDLAQDYFQSAQNFRQLFDAEQGYMRAKDEKGNWRPEFSPYSWGLDYAECSAIQSSLGVLHDIEGLKELLGGEEKFLAYLTKLCNDHPRFETGGYGFEIHEMSEMAAANFGQLAISNQPSFHIPYLFRYSRHPEFTSLLLKGIRSQTFQAGVAAFPGDEDNGSMAAWYIWSVLGFYPTCPGKPVYDVGIPVFNHIRIRLGQTGHWLDIQAHQNYPHFSFVDKVLLDGESVHQISHNQLLESRQLDFHLSWLPASHRPS
ncbi:GH92 family glycosyl hydrolase [Streptococcus sp. DD13]|uniref:GH92 family glycosyl hydrolase n=1 Tax=Streptococcus sp. DD13 TaxID=1777881 RepID=UPI000793D346|nr:GH92 family glycosyl hydrolase [Streptococcus sp. DD13]KXT78953.1 Alpha-1,2-mannosidase [Streptococcus sp. DD13]